MICRPLSYTCGNAVRSVFPLDGFSWKQYVVLLMLQLASSTAFRAPPISASKFRPKCPEIPEHYTYRYQVSDKDTGVYKEHAEFRTGGIIHGLLSLRKNDSRFDIQYKGSPKKGWKAFMERTPALTLTAGQEGLLPSHFAAKQRIPNEIALKPSVLKQTPSRSPGSNQDTSKLPLLHRDNSIFPILNQGTSRIPNTNYDMSRQPFLNQDTPRTSVLNQATLKPQVLDIGAPTPAPLYKPALIPSVLDIGASESPVLNNPALRPPVLKQIGPRPSQSPSKAAVGDSSLTKSTPERKSHKQSTSAYLRKGKVPPWPSLTAEAFSKPAVKRSPKRQAPVSHRKPIHSYKSVKELEKKHRLFYHHNHYHIDEKSSRGK